MARGRVPSVTLKCETCDALFHPWKKHIPARFCSGACAGRKHSIHMRKRCDQTCTNCGVLFYPVNNTTQTYCSRKCYQDSGTHKHTNPDGYVLVYSQKWSLRKSKQEIQHRVVMQESLGRRLEKHETVHHINGDRADNRIENLQVRSGRHGKGVIHKCSDCGSHNITSTRIA